jgi:hypothetical protein
VIPLAAVRNIGSVKLLRYAGLTALAALLAGGVAYLSESHLVSLFALVAMHLALLLGVAFVILSVGDSTRDP